MKTTLTAISLAITLIFIVVSGCGEADSNTVPPYHAPPLINNAQQFPSVDSPFVPPDCKEWEILIPYGFTPWDAAQCQNPTVQAKCEEFTILGDVIQSGGDLYGKHWCAIQPDSWTGEGIQWSCWLYPRSGDDETSDVSRDECFKELAPQPNEIVLRAKCRTTLQKALALDPTAEILRLESGRGGKHLCIASGEQITIWECWSRTDSLGRTSQISEHDCISQPEPEATDALSISPANEQCAASNINLTLVDAATDNDNILWCQFYYELLPTEYYACLNTIDNNLWITSGDFGGLFRPASSWWRGSLEKMVVGL